MVSPESLSGVNCSQNWEEGGQNTLQAPSGSSGETAQCPDTVIIALPLLGYKHIEQQNEFCMIQYILQPLMLIKVSKCHMGRL